jgi:hypothetical protein
MGLDKHLKKIWPAWFKRLPIPALNSSNELITLSTLFFRLSYTISSFKFIKINFI